jgi:outer membrane lipoprotein SlyB
MKSLTFLVVAASALAAFAAEPTFTPLTPPPSEVQGVRLATLCAACGVVSETKVETRKGDAHGIGVIGGAVVGGVLGHQVGGGSGKTAATVIGAVGGGLAGHEIEKKVHESKVWSTSVTLKDGSTRTYESTTEPGLRAGDVVRIENGRPVAASAPATANEGVSKP